MEYPVSPQNVLLPQYVSSICFSLLSQRNLQTLFAVQHCLLISLLNGYSSRVHCLCGIVWFHVSETCSIFQKFLMFYFLAEHPTSKTECSISSQEIFLPSKTFACHTDLVGTGAASVVSGPCHLNQKPNLQKVLLPFAPEEQCFTPLWSDAPSRFQNTLPALLFLLSNININI